MAEIGLRLKSMSCLIAISVFALADGHDLMIYLRDPSGYRGIIGGNGTGFRYTSEVHFLSYIAVSIAGAVVAAAVPRLVSSARKVVAVRAAVLSVMLFLLWVQVITFTR